MFSYFRAFRDIRVPQLLFAVWNTKKISVSCAGQLREHFVQSVFSIYYGQHLTSESDFPPDPIVSDTSYSILTAISKRYDKFVRNIKDSIAGGLD